MHRERYRRWIVWLWLCLPWPLLVAAAPLPNDEPAALHALNRLAYGPAPGDLQRVQAIGVAAYIDEQLHPERLAPPPALQARLAAMPALQWTPAELFRAYGWPAFNRVANDPEGIQQLKQAHDAAVQQASQAHLLLALYSPAQLQEVMVDFWFNHFNVFLDRSVETRIWVWPYERDAIRPYALGHFRDLLLATARHPAMLFYLDNWLNKRSDATRPASTGINENYAREVMELHTLGVNGGYTQQDVTALARILSGWTYRPEALEEGVDPAFFFDAAAHERSAKRFLGRRFAAGGGQEEGERALRLLARHPATAQRIAYRLAQFFVADQPPPRLVRRLTRRYLASDGEIRAVLKTLFASREFWDTRTYGAKFKTPLQYLASSLRASGLPMATDLSPLLAQLAASGQPLYGCLMPDGYKNTRVAWFNPDALLYRLNDASQLSLGQLPLWPPAAGIAPDPYVVQASQGRAFSSRTLQAVAAARADLRAGMLLGSPEFMQR